MHACRSTLEDPTRRVVDPVALFSAGGQWYLPAWCHHVDDERLFRVDRIRHADVLETSFEPRGDGQELTVYSPRPDDPRVTLDLAPAGRWVIEQYPVEGVTELDNGHLRVRLAASEWAWLERLLLRLGPGGRVVEGDAGIGPAAARRLLARYQGGAEPSQPGLSSENPAVPSDSR